jgi:uncharacterized integral membrane protein (TIGR00697 family)
MLNNEVIFIIIIIISFGVIAGSIRLGKEWLIATPPIIFLISIIFLPQFGKIFGITVGLSLPLFASTFLATDIAAEHYGKSIAQKIVWLGFFAEISLLVFSQIFLRVSVIETSQPINDAFHTVFASTPRIVVSSLTAYLISQHWDVWFYCWLRKKMQNRYLWVRNNLSTITSQFLDSFIMTFLAFWGILPDLLPFALTLWLIKIFLALCDTPFIYLSYKLLGKPLPIRYSHARGMDSNSPTP